MSNINLIDETIDILKQYNKTEDDVLWCGDNVSWCTWEEFKSKYSDFTYDNGYGGAEVTECLKVVGDGFWLLRGEYDGSEWWNYMTVPNKPLLHEIPLVDDDIHWQREFDKEI